jgi:hypothetical protein
MNKRVIVAFMAMLCLIGWNIDANAQSGQNAVGRSTVEPAVNDADGSLIFLHTPDGVTIPSVSNPRAAAPIYLTMFPVGSPIDPATLHCQPHNCNHVNVLPFATPGYPNGGKTCVNYGLPENQCSLVIGHDHLVGVPHTGDFNVAWHAILVVFTPEGIAQGAANHRTLTLQGVATLVTKGYAFEVSTPVTFNCSIVPASLYYRGVPLSF